MPSTESIYEGRGDSQAKFISESQWESEGNVVYPPMFQAGVTSTSGKNEKIIKELMAFAGGSTMKAEIGNLAVLPLTDISTDPAYVRISTATKSVSATVLMICIFSLAISFATGFTVIDRFISVVVAFMSAGFFVMGIVLESKNKNYATRTGHNKIGP